jgi:peroxiredoxin
MAQTLSSFLRPIGAAAPDFALPDPHGVVHTLSEFSTARALVVMFICNHCPYVKHLRQGIATIARELQPRGVAFVGISSNDIAAYPADAPDKMALEAAEAGYTFPYLFDESQEVAKAYKAACTPDFFVFGPARVGLAPSGPAQELVYQGQFDDSRPSSRTGGNTLPVTGSHIRAAIDAALSGSPYPDQMKHSIGCNIKWKPGNEPSYFTK